MFWTDLTTLRGKRSQSAVYTRTRSTRRDNKGFSLRFCSPAERESRKEESAPRRAGCSARRAARKAPSPADTHRAGSVLRPVVRAGEDLRLPRLHDTSGEIPPTPGRATAPPMARDPLRAGKH